MMGLKNKQFDLIVQVLRDINSREVDAIEKTESPNVAFSQNYDETIQNIFKKERVAKYNYKRIISIIAAAVLIIALTVTAFAFRKQIVDFIETLVPGGVRLEPDGGEFKPVEGYYVFSKLPEAYEVTYHTENKVQIETEWTNGENIIFLQQTVLTERYQVDIDTESEHYRKEKVGPYTVHYTYKYGTHTVVWENDRYGFVLDCFAELTWEEIKEMILTMEVLPLSEDGGVPEGN
ncbi:MAG: DUF4367 domain-containing protein [Clostridia bacterium]|nr:DUF4367 domain-containing protein [Clostridia bacterium]